MFFAQPILKIAGFGFLVSLLCGCASFQKKCEIAFQNHETNGAATLIVRPSRYTLAADPLIFHSNVEIQRELPMVRESQILRFTLMDLGMPASNEPIHIYLFDTESQFLQYANQRVPGFADRRAFFAQHQSRLEVYTFLSDALSTDLRHEVVHGYLHAAVPEIPLWLDEGLAEYFEVPQSEYGQHPDHEKLLSQAEQTGLPPPSMALVEAIVGPATMTSLDYARCWWMVKTQIESHTMHDLLSSGDFSGR
ncbi:MAG: hypothetical protein PHE53_08150 [Thermoguttaceae bacterium]|nr:hypothetical protein [Thermoguttaceae bacterium]